MSWYAIFTFFPFFYLFFFSILVSFALVVTSLYNQSHEFYIPGFSLCYFITYSTQGW
ncbi:hypothetical protein HanPSC8_Chr12g0534791 [Helianthus annuus]|nr:hypothetical protein HanPSC8_Chr12g0534791 [Helianthus annuus]